MPDTASLLALAVELQAGAGDPAKLPAAWQALCRCFDCPDIFGSGTAPALPPVHLRHDILNRTGRARSCALKASGRCGCGEQADSDKRMSCLALASHLEMTLRSASSDAAATVLRSPYLAALDALSFPLFVCGPDRGLIHANRAGREELQCGRWLQLDDKRISTRSTLLQARFAAAFGRVAGQAAPIADKPMPTTLVDGGDAQLGLRRICHSDGDVLVLVSLIPDRIEATPGQLSNMAERRVLPPRQRELAGFLLAGHSLNTAAAAMGISRRTASDHLKGLFRATGTRRQQDLLLKLARELLVE